MLIQSNLIGTAKTLLITSGGSLDNNANKLYFQGVAGYTNGINELNTICEKLYSNEYGTARSMNMDDVDKCVNNTIKKGWYYYKSVWYNTPDIETKVSDMTNVNGYPYSTDFKTYLGCNTQIADPSEYSQIDDVKMNAYGYKLNESQNKLLDARTGTEFAELTTIAKNIIFGVNNVCNKLDFWKKCAKRDRMECGKKLPHPACPFWLF